MIEIHNLNARTGLPLKCTPAQEAVSRCLAVLVVNANASAALKSEGRNVNSLLFQAAVAELTVTLMHAGSTLTEDIRALCGALNVEIEIEVETEEKGAAN